MKKLVYLFWVFVFVIAFSGVAAAEVSTPKEVVAKVTEAVKLIEEKGEAAFDIIRDKKGPFMWKGNYLYVLSYDGVMLLHPIVPKLEGRNMTAIKDVKGKMFNAEMIKLAKSPAGQGWLVYYWPKPGAKQASQKAGFVKGVPGKDMFVGSGVWDMTAKEAEAQAK
jgi:signal transduction histidine kinase